MFRSFAFGLSPRSRPVEQSLELVRRYTWGFVEDYFVLLRRAQRERQACERENGQLKIENHYLKNELSTADRARALSVFQARSPSKTVAARVIGNGTGANSKVVFVDRGSTSGVEKRHGGGDAGRHRRQSGGCLSHGFAGDADHRSHLRRRRAFRRRITCMARSKGKGTPSA